MNKNQEQDEFIAVRVQDPRVQNEGFWNSYVDFKIFLHTNSKAFTAKTSCVRRRYSEFVWLKKKLQKNSGLVPVPELPGKTPFFSFNNEDFIERRRRGLQNFLDKLVHMTVCLSDSQLHLFVQTQLPVRHIEDCIQGHTPYTVTDAILTYASSNRGWAQEEEGVAQEPSLHAVSYESVDSPAPHLPTLQCEKTFECRASVADIHEEDVNETCAHEVNGNDTNTCVIRGTEIGVEKETSEEDVHKAYVPETYTCVIRGTEASVDEKQNNEEGVHEVDVHETNTSVIGAIEDIAEKQDASEEDVQKADVHEHDYIPDFKPDPQDNDTFTLKVTLTHSEEDSNEDDSTSSCVIMGTDAGGDEKDIEQDVHEVEADTCVVRVTEAIGEEKHSNEEDIHTFYACEDNSCVIGAMDGTIEEKYVSEEDVLKTDVDETSTCLIRGIEANAMEKDSNEEDVPKVAAYDTNNCILWSMEGAIEEEDVSEEDAQDENAQETSTCVIGAIDSAIEKDASEEFVHETSAHEANTNEHNSIPNSKLDAQDTDTCVTLPDTHGEDTNEEDVHKVDTHDIITCVSGTTGDDTPERDSIVLSDSDNSQEELSIETNKDEADTNDAINSLIEASDAVVREDTQDTNSNTDPVHCANSFVFGASETIIHKIDGGKSVDHETENQEPEVHEIDNHTEFNGQLESTDTNC